MENARRAALGFAVAVVFFAQAAIASAATLFLTPGVTNVGPGQKFSVDVRVDGAGSGFNAAQATLRFPANLLQVVSVDKAGSQFSFWLQEPTFLNDQGVVSFIGGSPYGVSGAAIQVLRVTFSPKGTGKGTISVTDAAVTASDGSGTNILSTTTDATITVSPKNVTSGGAVPPPQQITRTPSSATVVEGVPTVSVSLYPDGTQWYSQVNPFNVSWNLPMDVSAVATAINKQPNFNPTASEGLFDNKTFDALSDGIWYLHVRFQNTLGWGPTSHNRIAIDTEPPLGFPLTALSGETSDNPAPTLQFKTDDALSGLKEYDVRVDTNEPIVIPAKGFTGSETLPLLSPGDHRVQVRAVDYANNSVEDFIVLHILPIASPTISFTTGQIFSDSQGGITVKGSATPGINVVLNVERDTATIASSTVTADAEGNWQHTFDQSFANGSYSVNVVSQDSRGAQSLTIISPTIKVLARPIVQLGAFQLGTSGAFILLLLILAAGFGGGYYYFKLQRETLLRRLQVAQSDVGKVFKIISDDAQKLKNTPGVPPENAMILERLQKNVEKMEGYLKKELENIKK